MLSEVDPRAHADRVGGGGKLHYFTKEWYALTQTTSLRFGLEEDERAEVFSEGLFQEIYDQRLKEFLHLQEELAAEGEIAKESYHKYEPFAKERVSAQFYQAFLHYQEHIKNILPAEILERIADIRVFALKKASRPVIKDVTQFCRNNIKLMLRTAEDYKKHYKKILENSDGGLIKEINFHDCIVRDVKQTEKVLSILFDNRSGGGLTNITEMHLESYRIIKQDALLQKSRWLYNEIYKVNDEYELHVLLQNLDIGIIKGLIEFVVSAKSISFN